MIVYSYQIADLVNNAQILSLLRTISMTDQGTEQVVDDYSLADEDEALIKKYLKLGCAEIASILEGYARNLLAEDNTTELEAFEFDVTYDSKEHSIVFRVNMPDTWTVSTTKLIDESIKDALENFVLWRIARHKQIESDSYSEWFNFNCNNIRSYLSRRTEPVKRNYSLF